MSTGICPVRREWRKKSSSDLALRTKAARSGTTHCAEESWRDAG